jgi:hypothetical protein
MHGKSMFEFLTFEIRFFQMISDGKKNNQKHLCMKNYV